jgi:hypothetical protein
MGVATVERGGDSQVVSSVTAQNKFCVHKKYSVIYTHEVLQMHRAKYQ